MHCMKFPPHWINWIKECLSSPTFSTMLNRLPFGFFGSNRGIRQGDPLSPYIFLLAMEFWTLHMDLTTAAGRIRPVKRGSANYVSHLLFADDILVFCKANRASFQEIELLLQNLSLNTGLSINKAKSKGVF